eukprot:CAMPEP_0117883394 /NCGR_PEP_ID=MMETSP0950-20121206/18104_1 /TAXON_ID=44440 /ORGANISM="Chattonella subsalsa, Strain CCMP2191" /LENGTH=234 /DNA_ID=CAMNT_0005739253 /DNA_START=364 /DNA_END=1066 /DNA_ORIENTATION=-
MAFILHLTDKERLPCGIHIELVSTSSQPEIKTNASLPRHDANSASSPSLSSSQAEETPSPLTGLSALDMDEGGDEEAFGKLDSRVLPTLRDRRQKGVMSTPPTGASKHKRHLSDSFLQGWASSPVPPGEEGVNVSSSVSKPMAERDRGMVYMKIKGQSQTLSQIFGVYQRVLRRLIKDFPMAALSKAGLLGHSLPHGMNHIAQVIMESNDHTLQASVSNIGKKDDRKAGLYKRK